MPDADDAAALAFLEKEGKEFDKVNTSSIRAPTLFMLTLSHRTQKSVAY